MRQDAAQGLTMGSPNWKVSSVLWPPFFPKGNVEMRQHLLSHRTFLLVVLSITAGFSPQAWAEDELFIANLPANFCSPFDASCGTVNVYPRIARGNTAPLRILAGPALKLFPGFLPAGGLAMDTISNELLVANGGVGSLLAYARDASCNAVPLRTVTGDLSVPVAVAVDTVNEELVVADTGNGQVIVYGLTATGLSPALRTLYDAAPDFSGPAGVAVDPVNNELAVVLSSVNSVKVYDRTASGNVAPLRILSGTATGLNSPVGVALDAIHNELLVLNRGPTSPPQSSLTVYARNASGNTAPLRTISGTSTGLANSVAFALDAVNNEIIVANLGSLSGTGSVTVYSRTATGNALPLRTLSGTATGLANPVAVMVAPSLAPDGPNVSISEYPIPTTNSGPQDIVTGPDGALWFSEPNQRQIGRITTDGDVTGEYGPTFSTPLRIVAGSDGNLWFTDNTKIGKITTGGTITEYPLAASGSQGITKIGRAHV